MRDSPEFRDAKVVIAGAPGAGKGELLEAVAARLGAEPPERIEGGAWTVLRSELVAEGMGIGLCCLTGPFDHGAAEELLLRGATGLIFLYDVSPEAMTRSRAAFEATLKRLERVGFDRSENPCVMQYHRVDREPRFQVEMLETWLGPAAGGMDRVMTASDAVDGEGLAFDRMAKLLSARVVA